ncbi:hypothetical protein [Priestia koreensis]|uniref:hypothetical protein n=1 Tax=Priestia koreensis TaxID=284581 RepID=UPI001F58F67E|nr:hypothetical protein [Priestia koreensis]UNL82900.1 hypothetical protein IE339_11830 [Priestia koreensis]
MNQHNDQEKREQIKKWSSKAAEVLEGPVSNPHQLKSQVHITKDSVIVKKYLQYRMAK